MALNIDPPGATFAASGDTSTFNVINLTENRLTFKVHFSMFTSLPYEILQVGRQMNRALCVFNSTSRIGKKRNGTRRRYKRKS